MKHTKQSVKKSNKVVKDISSSSMNDTSSSESSTCSSSNISSSSRDQISTSADSYDSSSIDSSDDNSNDESLKIDDSLYSRQLYTIGKDAMVAYNSASVLISGMTGLGVEVAKCIILSGVKNVTLHDQMTVRQKDLATNYYANDDDIGKYRTDVVQKKLSKLNPYVTVNVDRDIISDEHFKEHNVVIICDQLAYSQFENNRIARKYGTKFILANTFGTMGSIFCDFGDTFNVIDVDGELPKSGILMDIKAIGNELILSTNEQHQLCSDDIIMLNLNGNEIKSIVTKIKDVNTFVVKNTYKIKINACVNCKFTQIKTTSIEKFKTLEKSLINPEFVNIAFDDFERSELLHNFNMAINMFVKLKYRLPNPWDDNDVNDMFAFTNAQTKHQRNIIRKLTYTCQGKLCPVDSIIASISAQEVLKAISKKYKPINQWFYIDFSCIVPEKNDHNFGDDNINRYGAQTLIFGNDFVKKLTDSHIFVVGAGAIGCELLKNLAMMGIGNITITDMDKIEKSNLNRQFLFGNSDIGKFKSESVKKAISRINPNVNVISHNNKVADDTLEIYNEKFFKSVTCVMTALDNIQARLFVDNLCITNCKPLIDSGTLGTKANTQVIYPFLTESYGSMQDPPEQSVPMCTLKNFPYLIDHCIQYARNLFEGLFVKAPQNYIRYKKSADDFANMAPSELMEIVDDIKFVHENIAMNYKDCVKFAYELWHKQFRDQINDLIIKHPKNTKTEEGGKFWSGTKKFPTIVEFGDDSLNFIEAAANLWANVCNVKFGTMNHIKKYIQEFGKIEMKSNDEDEQKNHSTKQLLKSLPKNSDIIDNIVPLEFEKDDDTNFHIDFVTEASNSRAKIYGIEQADKFKTKGIAGKIIPAIITTTSLISGLATIELLKMLIGCNKLEDYKNSFVNLAIPIFALSDPVGVKKNMIGEYENTMWSNLKYKDTELRKIVNHLDKKINDKTIKMFSVDCGNKILLNMYSPDKKSSSIKLDTKISTLYENAYKKKCPKCVIISISFEKSTTGSEEDNDMDPIVCKIYT